MAEFCRRSKQAAIVDKPSSPTPEIGHWINTHRADCNDPPTMPVGQMMPLGRESLKALLLSSSIHAPS